MKRGPTIALVALLLAGCVDVGLPGNVPLEEATHKRPPALVAAVHGPTAEEGSELVVDGRLWVPWGRPAERAMSLRPVGSTGGTTIYAWPWDRSPYDAVFARDEGGKWQAYAPVIGQSGLAAPPAH